MILKRKSRCVLCRSKWRDCEDKVKHKGFRIIDYRNLKLTVERIAQTIYAEDLKDKKRMIEIMEKEVGIKIRCVA